MLREPRRWFLFWISRSVADRKAAATRIEIEENDGNRKKKIYHLGADRRDVDRCLRFSVAELANKDFSLKKI